MVEKLMWKEVEGGEDLEQRFAEAWSARRFGAFAGRRIVKLAGGFATRGIPARVVLKSLEESR